MKIVQNSQDNKEMEQNVEQMLVVKDKEYNSMGRAIIALITPGSQMVGNSVHQMSALVGKNYNLMDIVNFVQNIP